MLGLGLAGVVSLATLTEADAFAQNDTVFGNAARRQAFFRLPLILGMFSALQPDAVIEKPAP